MLVRDAYGELETYSRSSNRAKWYLRRTVHLVVFYSAYVMFGSVGVISSVCAAITGSLTASATTRRFGQKLIHGLFAFFVWYVRTCGLLKLEANELHKLRGARGLVLAANHPSLLDAVFVIAHLPNVFCLMKANVLHNIVLCGQAKLAGYVDNKSGVGLIRACRARMREGSTLLVFPEGTRTRGGRLGSFKMGFALVSQKMSAPVQTLIISYDHCFLGKEWPFFRPPPFPLRCTITLGKRFSPEAGTSAQALGQEVETYFRESVGEDMYQRSEAGDDD